MPRPESSWKNVLIKCKSDGIWDQLKNGRKMCFDMSRGIKWEESDTVLKLLFMNIVHWWNQVTMIDRDHAGYGKFNKNVRERIV